MQAGSPAATAVNTEKGIAGGTDEGRQPFHSVNE